MYIPELRSMFGKLFGRQEAEPVNAVGDADFTRPGWQNIGQYPLIEGYPASEIVNVMDGVETVPAAAAAVSIYADTLADLPKFVRRKGNRNDRLPDHWLTERLNDPHPGINGRKLWRWVGREIAARGECYLAIERQDGWPVEFMPARIQGAYGPGSMVDLAVPGAMVWVQIPSGMYTGGSMQRQYPAADILHFTDSDYDPFEGRAPSPLECRARNPIGVYKQIWNRYTQRLASGGHDTVYFTLPESADEWDAFLERFQKQAAGARNAGKPFPLPFGSDAKALTVTDVQRETLGMLNFLVIDVARAWGIPPFMIFARLGEGVSARARSDLAEQFLNWQRLRYASFVKNITAEIDLKVLRPLSLAGSRTARNVCVEFDLDHMTMGTFEGRSKVAVALHAGGLLTKNEARSLVDFDAIEGGDELPQVRGAPADSGGKGSSAGGDEPNDPDEDDSESEDE